MTSRIATLVPLTLVAILFSPIGSTQPLTWNYGSMSVLFLGEADNGNSENIDKGFRLDAARSINQYVFLRTRAETHDFDDVGVDMLQWGGGARFDVDGAMIPLQLWGGVNFERANVGGAVSDGIGIDLGVRAEIAPDFEGGVTYKTANLSGANSLEYDALELSAAYTGTRGFDVIATLNNARFDDDIELDLDHIIGVGVRIPF